MVNLGEYVEHLVKEKGLNKSELSRQLGMAWTSVNNWSSKGAIPRGSTMAKLMIALRATPEERARILELANTKPQQPSSHVGAPTTPQTAKDAIAELDALLTRAMDGHVHLISDAGAVLRALQEAAPLIKTLDDKEHAARAWLDAAVELRRLHQRVTGAALAVTVVRTTTAPPATVEVDDEIKGEPSGYVAPLERSDQKRKRARR